MAYIGNDLQVAYQSYQIIDDISSSFNGSTTSFALLVGGATPVPFPINEQQCLISVGGVIQEPDPSGTNGFKFSGGNIVFSSAPNTGEDFFGVILAGADYVNVGVNYPSGSESAPSITFDTDLDTGIYNPAANELGFSTNSVQRLKIESNGDINIDSGGVFYDATNNRLAIGTTSPVDTLQINKNATNAASGGLTLKSADSNESFLSLGVSTSLGKACITSSENGSGTVLPIAFTVGSSSTDERMRIDSSGRLLVGTSSTSAGTTAVLQGNSNASTGQALIYLQRGEAATSITNTETIGTIAFADSGSNQFASIVCAADANAESGDYPGRLVFSTTADGASSPTERMRINSTGVLIKYGDTSTARIIPQTDNAGYIGQSTYRWQAIYAVNGTIQTSDKREKTEIIDSPLGTDFIKSLRPVAYKWKVGGYEHSVDEEGEDVFTPVAGQRTHYGFIAQEVRQAAGDTDFGGWLLEDLSDPDSKQSLRLHEFISPMVKALQEAVAKIETLEAKVAALESA